MTEHGLPIAGDILMIWNICFSYEQILKQRSAPFETKRT